MSIITSPESDQQQRSSSLITFYRLDCPRCGTITVGEAVVGDPSWNSDGTVTCGKPEGEVCDYRAEPETREVDLAT